jgi:hypothetical protein
LEGYFNKAQIIERSRRESVELSNLRGEVNQLRGQVKQEARVGGFFHLGGYVLAILLAVIATVLAIVLFYFAEILKSH